MALNPQLDQFMAAFPHEGLTFDDVSLIARYADFLPPEADIGSKLTARIHVNIPFVSAAMDTVTESGMAIAMALQGGIGVVHKNLTPQRQASIVGTVKHYLNGLISHPITFRAGQTLGDVRKTREEKGYNFSGFPILDDQDRVVGILTAADIKFAENPKARIDDVMTRDVITAPPGTGIEDAYRIMMRHKIGKLPLVENGKLVGLYSFADVQSLIRNANPVYNRDAKYRLRVAAAIGPGDHARVEALADREVDVVVIDTAHGHSKGVLDMIRWVRAHYDAIDVVAGNIATGDAAIALRDAGAHAVKVGIGPGSICTTRVVTGVGTPQISAIYACVSALEDSIPVIADGGIRYSGDVAKAIVAGASTVMMGSVLAGTEESPGEKIIYQGRQYVVYRGMGSLGAMKANQGSRERYGQKDVGQEELVPQGIEGMIPFAGSLKQVLTQFCGGLQAAMGFVGCRTIDAMRREARFIRITASGNAEGHPHNVTITKEAPNYRS
ncbi:MAG TPA: IMP dehydrogenase [Kiritimatiellia bacterium]|nr:IMP dehydrogenase [Kiritimatiellia bacterium]HMO99065.1 IMP dehydrogenase [Kiritimatiellia bacterium]HMP97130.1 IMP dehydrogenase [Kiritimatiellia bacterium]